MGMNTMKAVPVTRETIGWRALPKRVYTCNNCQESYEHDTGYGHNIEKCQKKERQQDRTARGA